MSTKSPRLSSSTFSAAEVLRFGDGALGFAKTYAVVETRGEIEVTVGA